jgi:hypothetical protein
VSADTPALNFSGFSTVTSDQFVIGWEFDVLSPVEVTGLGMFDYNGLSNDGHYVAIWDPSAALVATAQVMPSDPATGYFRFATLSAPVTLAPGNGYRIAGLSMELYYAYGLVNPPTGWMVDPRIRYVQNRYLPGTNLDYPVNVDPYTAYGWFGPNMLLRDPSAVPEPALLQLPMLLGLSGFAWWRRRRV